MKSILKNRIFSLGFVLVSIIAIGLFVQSCSNDFDNFSDVTTVDSQKANLIAQQYLELQNDQYVLNLSEDAAFALGISKLDYTRMQAEVMQVNAKITELLQSSDNFVQLTDPQEKQIRNKIPRLKSGAETTPIGSGNIPDQNPFSFQIWVPSGVKSIHFDMYSMSLIGTGSVSATSAYGGDSDWFFQAFWVVGGNCNINLPASNTRYTVTLNVSSTFGGSYSYYWNY